jgi:hypothetical protein
MKIDAEILSRAGWKCYRVAPYCQRVSAALILFAALPVAIAVPAGEVQSIPAAAATSPRQAWAHKDRYIDLQLQGAGIAIDDPLAVLQVQQAFARFGIAYVEVRGDVLGSLFSDDAILELGSGEGKPFRRVGRPAITRQLTDAARQQGDQRRHLISNVLIERMTKSEAKAIAYGVVTVAADGLYLGASVIYSATLRRESDGAWRFTSLLIGMDSYVGRKPVVRD